MMHSYNAAQQKLLSSAFGYLLFDKWPDLQFTSTEDTMMYRALELAALGVGRTPSPVGSVLAKGAHVIAEAYHLRPGLPHAEAQTLTAAGENARAAELYITLEPCSHTSKKTPPCVEQVLQSKVSKIRLGTLDPNPAVNGDGYKALQDAQFDVKLSADSFIEALSLGLIAPFATAMKKRRPYMVLKMASSLDGHVAARSGVETQITGQETEVLVHRLRDKCDGIAAGRQTVEVDDPKLTVRAITPADSRQPLRILFDSQLRLQPHLQVFSTKDCVVIHDVKAGQDRQEVFDQAGIDRIAVAMNEGSLDLAEALEKLCQRGVTSILLEGGPKLWTSFINAGLVDEIWWFSSPVVFGLPGMPAIENLTPNAQTWLADPAHSLHSHAVGRDQLTIMRIQKPL